ISLSWLDTEAMEAIWALPSTGVAISPSFSESASTAFSMPRFRAAGAAPEATLRRPSCTMAWARTVAVVVPSPATSLVLVATSLVSCAPRFSYGSSSSISRAMVTPSLVMVGAPHFLSRTTLRPLGPSVTLTVLASLSTPRSRARRASSLYRISLAISFRASVHSVVDDGEDVAGAEDEELLVAVLQLGAAVLGEDDLVADLDVHGDALALVVEAAGADGDDLALLGLLLRGVRDDQAGGRGLLGLERLDDDTILEGLDGDRH